MRERLCRMNEVHYLSDCRISKLYLDIYLCACLLGERPRAVWDSLLILSCTEVEPMGGGADAVEQCLVDMKR